MHIVRFSKICSGIRLNKINLLKKIIFSAALLSAPLFLPWLTSCFQHMNMHCVLSIIMMFVFSCFIFISLFNLCLACCMTLYDAFTCINNSKTFRNPNGLNYAMINFDRSSLIVLFVDNIVDGVK